MSLSKKKTDRQQSEDINKLQKENEEQQKDISENTERSKKAEKDTEQLKSDLENKINEDTVIHEENKQKNASQDKKINDVTNKLNSEATKLQVLYDSIELEKSKINELFTKVYDLTQVDNVTDFNIKSHSKSVKELKDDMLENNVLDSIQSDKITLNKNNIVSNTQYIEKLDELLKRNNTYDKWTRAFSVISLIGTIIMFYTIFFSGLVL